jgi:hypothetical protein
MAYPFIFLLLVIVVAIVATPLWRARGRTESHAVEQARRADLEAARDAKLAEIRDAELDHRTGKLSDADHRALERQLRAEAVEILRELDALGVEKGE